MTALSFPGPARCRKTTLTLTGAAVIAALLSPFGSGPLFAQTPAAAPPAPAPTAPAPTAADSKMRSRSPLPPGSARSGWASEASALVTPSIAVRLGYNGYSYSHTESYQGVDYDGKLKLSSVPLLADLYPSTHSGFHVTAGLLFNSNSVTAHGKPNVSGGTQTFTLNGNIYTVSDVGSLNARMTFSKTSPYLGIGFGKPAGGGSMVQFLFDLGVVFQGKPKLSLTRSGGTTDPTLSATINNAVSAQRAKTQSDVNKFQYYPVVSFGVGYHF